MFAAVVVDVGGERQRSDTRRCSWIAGASGCVEGDDDGETAVRKRTDGDAGGVAGGEGGSAAAAAVRRCVFEWKKLLVPEPEAGVVGRDWIGWDLGDVGGVRGGCKWEV